MLAFQLNPSPLSISDTGEGETAQKADIVLLSCHVSREIANNFSTGPFRFPQPFL